MVAKISSADGPARPAVVTSTLQMRAPYRQSCGQRPIISAEPGGIGFEAVAQAVKAGNRIALIFHGEAGLGAARVQTEDGPHAPNR